MSFRTLASVGAALAISGSADAAGSHANPIRKAVTLLQHIQEKVNQEAERDEKLHSKFMCYCKNGASTLEQSIADAEAKIESVGSALKEAEAQKLQLEQDLKMHKKDRAEAKTAVDEATAIRSKEANTFASFKAEAEANIAAIGKAVSALERGAAGSFLQTSAAQVLRQIVQSKELSDADRQDMMAFLQGGSQYAPQSGQITGMLKQMGDDMSADLSDAQAAENAAIKSFDELMAAKTKEIDAATAAIETKSTRLGEVGVSIAEMKGDLGDNVDSLADDKKFLKDLKKNCGSAQEKYDAVVKSRGEELVALADTIKILNSDEALELFKKTLPSGAAANFLQVRVTTSMVRSRALAVLRAAHQPRLDLISLALHGKKGFGAVTKMIDEMVVLLKKEQDDDNTKKKFCDDELDTSDDKKKSLERSVADAEKAIADAKEAVASLTSEIETLKSDVATLDKEVAEATELRKAENAEFKDLMANNGAAIKVIEFAKNRLNKFYNPSLYVAPEKRELSEEDRIAVNNGETLAPTPAPGGISGTGVTVLVDVNAHAGVAPPDAPEAVGDFTKKSEETTGVIAMLDLLIRDLEKEMTVASTTEKDAQADYEQAMSDAAKKRADDLKSIEDKESAKADTDAALLAHKEDRASAGEELMETLKYIQSLHNDCDWLLKFFDVRVEARTSEIDALGKAKAVLSGADYSLLQTTATRVQKSLRGGQ